eukprot:958901_1
MSSNTTIAKADTITTKEMMTNFDRLHQLVSQQQSVIDDLRNNVQQLQRKQCEILSHIHFHIPSKSKDCPFKPLVNHNPCKSQLHSRHYGYEILQFIRI